MYVVVVSCMSIVLSLDWGPRLCGCCLSFLSVRLSVRVVVVGGLSVKKGTEKEGSTGLARDMAVLQGRWRRLGSILTSTWIGTTPCHPSYSTARKCTGNFPKNSSRASSSL